MIENIEGGCIPMPEEQGIEFCQVNALFSHFSDDPVLGSLRRDVYLHLSLAKSNPFKYKTKAYLYPIWLFKEFTSATLGRQHLPDSFAADYVFLIKYAPAGGFGTVIPLINELSRRKYRLLILVSQQVSRQKAEELKKIKSALVVNIDSLVIPLLSRRYSNLRRETQLKMNCLLEASRNNHILKQELEFYSNVLNVFIISSLCYQEIMSSLLTRYASEAKAFITHTDVSPLAHVTITCARKLGLREFTLQHGLPVEAYFPTYSQNYVIWGEKARKTFIENGTPGQNLLLWGCPRFDIIEEVKARKNPQQIKARLQSLFPLSPEKKIILFLSHTHNYNQHPEFFSTTLKNLRKFIQLNSNKHSILIKLHPQETKALYKKLFAPIEYRKLCFIKHEIPLYDLLNGVDAAMSPFSTTLLESMLFEVPTVQLNFPRWADIPDYSRTSGGIYIEDINELDAILDRVFREEAFRHKVLKRQMDFCYNYLCNLGRATKYIADQIQ